MGRSKNRVRVVECAAFANRLKTTGTVRVHGAHNIYTFIDNIIRHRYLNAERAARELRRRIKTAVIY